MPKHLRLSRCTAKKVCKWNMLVRRSRNTWMGDDKIYFKNTECGLD
jgi:hypothetical protein